MRLADLAERLECDLEGDGDVEIARVSPIENAEPGSITFVANPRYTTYLRTTGASAVILDRNAAAVEIPTLRAGDPYLAFARAIDVFHVPVRWPEGVDPTAVIGRDVHLGARASIGPYVVIGDRARIGDDARIAAHVVIYPEVVVGDRFTAHAHVTVRERVQIGSDVILHAGAVVGSDGFGYVPGPQGDILKITQGGNVVLEDAVEIGANATVDRAAVGSTRIRHATKIDNLVTVAHGCDVGPAAMLAAQVGLAGSTRVGRFVRMGGQAGAAGHLRIGDGAQVAAQAGINNSVADGVVVGGYPAIEISRWRRVSAVWRKLPELLRRVRRIEKHLGLPGD